MKTTINQLAAITLFALLFFVGNVNAKGTELDALNQIETEETLEIENWMVSDNIWDSGTTYIFEKANEIYLELESWMTEDSIWETNKTINTDTEIEKELTIAPWMVNENIWNK